ncbi:ATP-binding protein [Streptomyces fagopyri]|uniref:ATP-binding protein n=1 Tax=Streptomyces fagopyri TaxID=2662397 RepID=A0A5Q0LKL5_9ACTN|nr:ATP-binding protein [Streptomyces fagopyri]QFZ76967.1 ATP-binding protein [Streptomyces fagopyri]
MARVTPSAPLGTDTAEDRSGLRAIAGLRSRAVRGRRFRFELAAHPASVARARQLTRARLAGWALSDDTCDTAVLVVSELVTNAILHSASSRVVCELHDNDDLVRIAVRDEGRAPGEPRPSPRRPDEEHGRGLPLVAAMCRAWGAQDTGPGLLVWADLPRCPSTGAESARSDLGWTAKKPASEGRGTGTEASRGTGAGTEAAWGTGTETSWGTGTEWL